MKFKFQCPRCKEIVELVEFTTSIEGLRLRCAACREILFLANPNSLPPEATPDLPSEPLPPTIPPPPVGAPEAVECPKCGHEQRDPRACERCGLVFSRFDPASLPPDPPQAAGRWQALLASPDDPAAQDAFLEACRAAGRWDYATRQARVLSRRADGRQAGERLRTRILSMAQAELLPLAAGGTDRRSDPRRRSRVVAWVVVSAALLGLAAYIYYLSDALGRLRP